jgi:hypothetical protein
MEDIPFETAGLVADDVRALELTYNELKKSSILVCLATCPCPSKNSTYLVITQTWW